MESREGEKRKREMVEKWWLERAREVLVAQGKVFDFDIEDVDRDELREKVQNVARSRRMREEGFSIQIEGEGSGQAGRRLIWDEVMRW